MTADPEPTVKVALSPLPPWTPERLAQREAALSPSRWGTPRYEAAEVDPLLADYAKALTMARQDAEEARVRADGYARQIREGPAQDLPSRDQLGEMDAHQLQMEQYQDGVEAYCAQLLEDTRAEVEEMQRASTAGPLVEPIGTGDVAVDAEATAEWADRVEDYAQGRRRQAEDAVEAEYNRLGAVRSRLTRARQETDRRAAIRGTAVVRGMTTAEAEEGARATTAALRASADSLPAGLAPTASGTPREETS